MAAEVEGGSVTVGVADMGVRVGVDALGMLLNVAWIMHLRKNRSLVSEFACSIHYTLYEIKVLSIRRI